MSSSCDTLYFSLPAHGNSVLHKMNALREDRRFCDITLIFGSPNTSAEQCVHFHGHRVVLAASSDFFRDQFLLHEDQAEMSVAAVSSARVAKSLLLSCYTGLLEVPYSVSRDAVMEKKNVSFVEAPLEVIDSIGVTLSACGFEVEELWQTPLQTILCLCLFLHFNFIEQCI